MIVCVVLILPVKCCLVHGNIFWEENLFDSIQRRLTFGIDLPRRLIQMLMLEAE